VARAKISLPVSALKQDDDALGLINFFATGNRPRPNANYRRSPSAMRTRQVQNALDILAELSLQLVSLSDPPAAFVRARGAEPRRALESA
jgi:hypothetical protein